MSKTRVVAVIALIVLLLVLLVPKLVKGQTTSDFPPAGAKVEWTSPTTAKLTWTQLSDATEAWIWKQRGGEMIAILGRLPGLQGRFFDIRLPQPNPPIDAKARPQEGEKYYIIECKRRDDLHVEWCAEWGHYELGPAPAPAPELQKDYLPVIAR